MKDLAELFIDDRLDLGEGPIWHGARAEFIWFDINEGHLFRADARGRMRGTIEFGRPAAAAGIVDERRLAVIVAGALLLVDLESGVQEEIVAVEADRPGNRPNDSRVDPAGGFWIGTMGRRGEPKAGAYYQYRAGRLQKLFPGITTPNSTCFAPDGRTAYFADSPARKIMRVAIDKATGLPEGKPSVFVDLGSSKAVPDGSVVDQEGFLWNAEYHGSRVVRYAPDGKLDRVVKLPVSQVTCPCFGGPELKTLFITTASQGLSDEQRRGEPHAGSCFAIEVDVPGLKETPIRL